MKIVKKAFKWLLYFLIIPITYLVISLVLTFITIDREVDNEILDKTIYLSTNGVHLDIVIPKNHLESALMAGLKRNETDTYFSFGWGDENFYINTPTWGDLTFNNAFQAMFLKSTALMHVTRYRQRGADWIEIQVRASELQKLSTYLLNSFKVDKDGKKIILENQGYTAIDDFYKAKGSYSCLNTCNTWVNTGFKESGLKSSLWTPFDFGLMRKYE